MTNSNRQQIEQTLQHITKQLLVDLHNDSAIRALSLDADLEKQLGIGSIEKAELFYRIENTFSIQLPEALLSQSETLRQLCDAVVTASPFIKPLPSGHYPKIQATEIEPTKSKTLIEALINHAENEPDRPHAFFQNERGEEKVISYNLLYQTSLQIAGNLQQLGLDSEQTVAIMLPTGEEFFYAFFGVLLAGGIPVPIYPPFRRNKLEEYISRETKILRNAQVHTLITFSEVAALSHVLLSFVPTLQHVVTVEDLLKSENPNFTRLNIQAMNPALIQYTSGSTGDPKGVLLSHDNLVCNIRAGGEAINLKPTDSFVSWLPLYHDMGLIGAWLGSMYFGLPLTILSPLTFLTHPEKWLWAIHYHRGTLSASPNFGYELCLNKIDEQSLQGLDLSSWRVAFNGAEAVYPNTLRRFAKRFKKYGFHNESLMPVYGLAENSVALAFPPVGRGPVYDKVKRDEFDNTQKAIPTRSGDKHFHEFVSCGSAIPGHKIRIVNKKGNVVPDRTVGRLQFQGPSTMQGYYLRPDATANVKHDGWTDSGDYAYIADDEVYITGREKDVIIKAGRNLYPAEIEELVGDLEGIRKGCVVAFGYVDRFKGTEDFVILAESHQRDSKQQRELKEKITTIVADNLGLPPDVIIICKPGSIPKTSSGKLQRAQSKQLFLDRKLLHKPLPVSWQMIKIYGKSGFNRLTHTLKTGLKIIYTLYMVTVFTLLAMPCYLLMLLLPTHGARLVLKTWCRLLFLFAACPIKVENKQRLKQSPVTIYVSNHASYMDSLLLIVTLPKNVAFVAKAELTSSTFFRLLLKSVGYLTVNRMDFAKSLEDTKNIKAILDNDEAVMIYPEGTFTPATGVRPFRLGAFQMAVDIKCSLTPVAIRGTRQLLRAKTLLLSPSKLSVWIGKPIIPKSTDFSEVIRLRSEIREIISEACGERTINLVRAGPEKR